MFRVRTGRSLLLAIPLAVLPAFAGCDSATGPKFPDPIEEEEDSTIEEGMTRRWTMAPTDTRMDGMLRGVMPFTFTAPEKT